MSSIDTSNWGKFKVGDLLIYETTGGIASKNNLSNGNIPYITRSAENNGLSGFCGNEENIVKGNCITIGAEGFTAFYQKEDFVAGNKVYALRHENMTENIGKYLATVLNRLSSNYSFSNARVLDKIKNEIILLPIKEYEPDWDYMESYMKKVMEETEEYIRIVGGHSFKNNPIDVSKWGEFDVNNFFTVLSGRAKLSNADIDDGDTPVYSSNSTNGGVFGYTTKSPDYEVDSENPFYITFGDHTKAVNIADKSFCVMDNVKVLTSNIRNYNILHFIITSWLKNIPDLGYARHWGEAEKAKIWLPITSTGEPDWQYMEEYMKNIIDEEEKSIQAFSSI